MQVLIEYDYQLFVANVTPAALASFLEVFDSLQAVRTDYMNNEILYVYRSDPVKVAVSSFKHNVVLTEAEFMAIKDQKDA